MLLLDRVPGNLITQEEIYMHDVDILTRYCNDRSLLAMVRIDEGYEYM